MEVPIDKIVDTYVKIRDKKEEMYRAYKEITAELEEQMKELKQKLHE
jgi:ribosome-associated translation inhibitor RaiA